jgi:hypothetical protein
MGKYSEENIHDVSTHVVSGFMSSWLQEAVCQTFALRGERMDIKSTSTAMMASWRFGEALAERYG